MVPPKNDPRWQDIILAKELPEFKALPTKLLMMRVRLLSKDNTPEKIKEAIDIVHDFFTTNSLIVADDIRMLFGNQESEK